MKLLNKYNNDGIKIAKLFRFLACVFFAFIWLSGPSLSKLSLEVYGGYQTSPHSVVTGNQIVDNVNLPFEFTAGWVGKSFSMPPYYGYRFTNWSEKSGWGLEFTHSKVYADKPTLDQAEFTTLQFTDGLNNLILHRQHLFDEPVGIFKPYFGYGIGVIIPHVEFQGHLSSPLTFEYQIGGPTVALNTGIKYRLDEGRFLFSEYKFTASWLNVDLHGGGALETLILTNALNLGFGFDF